MDTPDVSDLLALLNRGLVHPRGDQTTGNTAKTALKELLGNDQAMRELLFGKVTQDPRTRYELYQI